MLKSEGFEQFGVISGVGKNNLYAKNLSLILFNFSLILLEFTN